MRMLTKEWYQTMLDSGLGVQLRTDARAALFSEAVFRELWEEKLSDWLQLRKELCPELDQVYDEAGERQYFAENYRRELEHFRTRTPERILAKVADIRLLALGCCTEEVFADLREYRARCREWTERTMEEAWNLRAARGLETIWTGGHSLHDSYVLSLKQEGEDLLLEFRRDEVQWPEIQAVRFHNARILKQELPPEDAWWLYDEIWQTEEGYEIHALLWRGDAVFELTVQCRRPEVIWTRPPKEE